MTRLRIRRRDPVVGIALGSDELVAVIPGERAPRRWPLAPAGPGEAISPDLGGALGALRAGLRTGGVRHTLAVALLPALAEMRMVELPGVDADDAARVLSRAASRYFPVADGVPFDIAVEGTGARHRSPFIAIATRRGVLDAIALAARANGFAVARLTSAYSAWAAAASDGGVEDGKSVALRLADRVELVQLRAGRVAAVRRLPVAAEASVARAIDGAVTLAEPAEVLAARFADAAREPFLRTEVEHAALARRTQRASSARFAVAAVLLVLAGIADLRGSNRERAAIERQRAMLRAPVTRALADRDSLAGAMDRIASLRSTIDGAPVWSRVVASLAAELPADAFLTSLHASADTLRLEGSAPRAAAVFQALRADPAVRSLHLQGPIRQTVSEDGSTSEGFTLVAVTGRVP